MRINVYIKEYEGAEYELTVGNRPVADEAEAGQVGTYFIANAMYAGAVDGYWDWAEDSAPSPTN